MVLVSRNMKIYCTVCVLLFSVVAMSQQQHTSTRNYADSTPLRPDELSRQLTTGVANDLQKVTAIFRWITSNISYNVRPAYGSKKQIKGIGIFAEEDVADSITLPSLDERVAMDVLQRGVAFCDGYARLFKTMCNYAGIKCEVITGYASNLGRKVSFRSNHRWNAVLIDSTWRLVDATWASGFITYTSNEFIRHLDERYFLTPPALFAYDHYPEDVRWTLLQDVPNLREFKYWPYRADAFVKSEILAYKPLSGTIEAQPGDTIVFETTSRRADLAMAVLDTVSLDSVSIKQTYLLRQHQQVQKGANSFIYSYYYVVPPQPKTWLQVICNDELVLRYRLQPPKNLVTTTN